MSESLTLRAHALKEYDETDTFPIVSSAFRTAFKHGIERANWDKARSRVRFEGHVFRVTLSPRLSNLGGAQFEYKCEDTGEYVSVGSAYDLGRLIARAERKQP